MQAPYIPAPDALFNAWLNNFSTLLTATPVVYGLIAGDATAVAAVVAPWNVAYGQSVDPATRTSVTISAKDAARTVAESTARIYAQQISRNSGVANDDKTAIGVNLPNTARTPVPPPTTVPGLSLIGAIHFQHSLAFRDTSTPTTKAKPAGVIGLDLRVALAAFPVADPDIANPVAQVTKSPLVIPYGAADVGKVATYFGRWVTRSGPGGAAQFGPWSAPLAAGVI